MYPKQYEIYEFDLRECVSDEEIPEKILLGAILSPDVMNEVLRTVILAPICTRCKEMPTTFKIDENHFIRLDQISSVNQKRIIKRVGIISQTQTHKIKSTLKEMLID